MKIVKLMGGLGNQMFQYSFAKALGDDVLFDVSWFKRDGNVDHAIYGLSDFNTNVNIATEEQVKSCLNESYLAQSVTNLYKIFGLKMFQTNRVYEKVRNKFQSELLHLNQDSYYDGYFQNPLYFNNIKNRLINDFKPKKELTADNLKLFDKIQKTNSIAVSVRCKDDYVKLGWSLPWSYYNNAIEEISKRIENPVFYLFADDINNAMQNIDCKFKMIPCPSYDDNSRYSCGIYMMSHCRHAIIANSTYSWWGGYLNINKDSIIMFPDGWLPNNKIIKSSYKDLKLDSWVEVKRCV